MQLNRIIIISLIATIALSDLISAQEKKSQNSILSEMNNLSGDSLITRIDFEPSENFSNLRNLFKSTVVAIGDPEKNYEHFGNLIDVESLGACCGDTNESIHNPNIARRYWYDGVAITMWLGHVNDFIIYSSKYSLESGMMVGMPISKISSIVNKIDLKNNERGCVEIYYGFVLRLFYENRRIKYILSWSGSP